MSSSMIIGRDVIKKLNISLDAINEGESGENNLEILNIDISGSEKVSESLNINPKISFDNKMKLSHIFEKEYVQSERSTEPKVNVELKLMDTVA